MPKIKNPYKGNQLLLELEFWEPPRFAMRDIQPEQIRFLALQRGRDVPAVGLAIATNDAGYMRITIFAGWTDARIDSTETSNFAPRTFASDCV